LRKWLAPLLHDATLLADFKADMDSFRACVMDEFLKSNADISFLRGKIEAIDDIRNGVTMHLNEEASRARRPA